MTLNQIIYFIELCKTRKFTTAAANLYISQSTLSYEISKLEDELGTSLFIRSQNKLLEMTEAANIFLEKAKPGLGLLEEAKNDVLSLTNEISGKVTIGFFFGTGMTVVPDILTKFYNDHSDTKIDIKSKVFHNWINLPTLLENGECDLIISADQLGKGFSSILIAKQSVECSVPINHPFAMQESVYIKDLKNETIILPSFNSNLDRKVKELLKENNISPRIIYCDDWISQQLEILSGKGLGLQSETYLNEQYLKLIKVADQNATIPLYLSWPLNRKLSKATEAIRDFIIDYK